jgi:palmitoyl transferase
MLFASAAARAEEPPSTWDRMLSAINSTTTFPLASKEQQAEGWFTGVWDGTKRVWSEGRTDIYFSGYYWHMAYRFTEEDRASYNNWGWGGGYGRSLTDEKDNQRMLFGMVVADSFNKPMYLAGYGWLARWKLAGDLRVGAGYTVTIISNSKATNYIPFPAPTPLASVGTDDVALYATFLNGILYFFGKVTF